MQEILEDFLDSKSRSTWIETEKFKMYVRKSMRNINGDNELVHCFDLATIEVDERHYNQGVLGEVLDTIISIGAAHNIPYLYVENMLNPYMVKAVQRRNFSIIIIGQIECAFLRLSE